MFYGDEGKKVIEHVRRPLLPWRSAEDTHTECGLSITGPTVLTREQFQRKVKDQGVQRAALSTCMTCFDTAQRHPTWEDDPGRCLSRETERAWRGNERFKRELRALAALVSRHREEFAELMQDQEQIIPIEVVKATSRQSDKRKPGNN